MLSKLIYQAFFEGSARGSAQEVGAGQRHDILRKGERSPYVTMVIDGWAASYTQLSHGPRQLHTIFLPGDLCDSGVSHTGVLDYSVMALSRVRLACLPRELFDGLTEGHPALARAVWRQELLQAAMLRQLTTAIGTKPAHERLAHVLAEIFLRMQARGYTENDSCPFLITQSDLAELVGLTPVHVNRMLQLLRRDGLIVQGGRTLRIPDMQRLLQVARLDPAYLGLGKVSAPEEEPDPRPMAL
ncbi:MAG TPA: Crp/Fnr family transcriptional regulator [Allosphingosinicella sp.]|nr:Crp/Fnr family transcriptional regulator [Allosphingosinicella sp.]